MLPYSLWNKSFVEMFTTLLIAVETTMLVIVCTLLYFMGKDKVKKQQTLEAIIGAIQSRVGSPATMAKLSGLLQYGMTCLSSIFTPAEPVTITSGDVMIIPFQHKGQNYKYYARYDGGEFRQGKTYSGILGDTITDLKHNPGLPFDETLARELGYDRIEIEEPDLFG